MTGKIRTLDSRILRHSFSDCTGTPLYIQKPSALNSLDLIRWLSMFPTFNLKSYFVWVFYGPQPLSNPPGPPSGPRDTSTVSEYTPYTESSNLMVLPDGRKLGYAQYGSPTGKPVIFLHGMPGSRLDAAHFDDVGKELGARIIGIDRPGIGWSTPQPNRTILSHAQDVEALTDHLKIDKVRVMVRSNSLFGGIDPTKLILYRECLQVGRTHLPAQKCYRATNSRQFQSCAVLDHSISTRPPKV